MINIESLKDYYGIINDEEFMSLAIKINISSNSICEYYLKYKEWYFTKQLPAIVGKDRNILFVRKLENQDEIISMACLKKMKKRKKYALYMLYVLDKYRELVIGTSIIEKSMKWLKPFITLADYKLEIFKQIINKYNWKFTEIVFGLYNDGTQELFFNETFVKNGEDTLEQQLHKRLIKAVEYRKK